MYSRATMTVNPDLAEPGREPVLMQVADGVTRLILNRPERRNAVDTPTANALQTALRQAIESPECRVIVLSGAGSTFCAGWDIAAIAELRAGSEADVRAEFEANRRLLSELAAAPQATVAEVRGAVLGFGIGLVSACDIAVAGRSASIGLPEIALGVVPGMVLLDVLDALPSKVALDWLLSGEHHSAEEALAAGLLSRVVADDDLEPAVDALARRLAGHDPETLRETKRMFHRLRALDRADAESAAIEAAVRALLRP